MFDRIWKFLSGREHATINRIQEFIRIVERSILSLTLELERGLEGDREVAKAHFIACTAYADRATDARIELIQELSAGAFYAGLGELFISLVDELKNAADATKRAARTLQTLSSSPDGVTILRTQREGLKQMVGLAQEALQDIRASLANLLTDRDESLARALHTNELEEEADFSKQKVLDLLITEGGKEDELNLLLVNIDDIVDTCSNASVHIAKIISRSGQ